MRQVLLGTSICVGLIACTDPTSTQLSSSSYLVGNDPASAPENGASVFWNRVARDLIVANGSNPFQAIRNLALMSVAQYHAAVEAEDRDGASTRAAIAAASVAALSSAYPTNSTDLEAKLDSFLGGDSPDAAESKGEQIGREIAQQMVIRTQGDGFFAPWTGTVPVGEGLWFSATPPIGPQFGQARTYLLISGSQFRPGPPPAFGSRAFTEALSEVRRIADTRTPEQDAIAKFWNFPAGTYQPPGYWNELASRLAVRYRLADREAAHVLALMNMVGFDAIVATHDAKFTYWLIRPSQADPAIELAIGLPNFPSYPSNHATLSSGMARILAEKFPAQRARLKRLADEAAMSRLLGGIHYRFDNDTGLKLGRRIAEWAIQHDVDGHRPFELR